MKPTLQTVSLMTYMSKKMIIIEVGDDKDHEPDSNKVDGHIDREGVLEFGSKEKCFVVLP
jgi:hypothetical protein